MEPLLLEARSHWLAEVWGSGSSWYSIFTSTQYAGADCRSQTFIPVVHYMNNCLQFWLQILVKGGVMSPGIMQWCVLWIAIWLVMISFLYCMMPTFTSACSWTGVVDVAGRAVAVADYGTGLGGWRRIILALVLQTVVPSSRRRHSQIGLRIKRQ